MRHWVRPRSRRDELGMRNERCAELVLVRASEDSALAPPLAALARRQVARAGCSRRQRPNDPRPQRPRGWVMTFCVAYPAGSDRDRAVRAPAHPRRSCGVLLTDALPPRFNLARCGRRAPPCSLSDSSVFGCARAGWRGRGRAARSAPAPCGRYAQRSSLDVGPLRPLLVRQARHRSLVKRAAGGCACLASRRARRRRRRRPSGGQGGGSPLASTCFPHLRARLPSRRPGVNVCV